MRQQLTTKNPANYEVQNQKETCQFDQKSIKNFDQFSNSEKREVKEWAEKRIAERREKAEDLKAKKRKQKSEENKIKEGKMWNRLDELNSQFKKIRKRVRKYLLL